MTISPSLKKKLLISVTAACIVALAWWGWTKFADNGLGDGFASGNGRIEATEIDIATKLAGRIEDILVREGDFVTAGQPLARMQLETLDAQRNEAMAMRQQAEHTVTAAQAQVALREAEVSAALALVGQRESELDAAKRRLKRSQTLSSEGAASMQELDDDQARVSGAQAALAATKAQAAAARAAVEAAKAQLVGVRSSVSAATATIERIEADIRDSELRAPRDGRVQIRVAQPGEVLGSGGRVLNLIDLSDVYITFFLPGTVAGRIGIGSEVRIVLDAAPEYVIPAAVSFVASTAQFTPKTVETASERQKLMFRVRAQISQELLREHLDQVKTGLPGVAWVKLDANIDWPENLSIRLPE
ncbi:HlyD family secretion protein [Halopseudomonas pelagia]|uniref:HlyD family secretion protein n=1 Tax=Halopseudomonas pelagia TaxID=553151 RepID=UPI00039A1C17|nr:HlyD family efflux transporter periplasmic adaptor subunit [Halopseudomonas pelagia]